MNTRAMKFVARPPQEIAKAVGLTETQSKEWQNQFVFPRRLRRFVRENRLTRAEVIRRGVVSRTRGTLILDGNLDRVSSEMLIQLLQSLGYRVRIPVSCADMAK